MAERIGRGLYIQSRAIATCCMNQNIENYSSLVILSESQTTKGSAAEVERPRCCVCNHAALGDSPQNAVTRAAIL